MHGFHFVSKKLQLHHKFPLATYYTITYYSKIIMETAVAVFDIRWFVIWSRYVILELQEGFTSDATMSNQPRQLSVWKARPLKLNQ